MQQERVLQLRGAGSAKLEELAQTIALYKSGQMEQAKALVISGKGLGQMDAIRTLIRDMSDEEIRLQGIRSQNYKRSVRATTASIFLASAFAVIGLVLFAYYMLRNMSLKEIHAPG